MRTYALAALAVALLATAAVQAEPATSQPVQAYPALQKQLAKAQARVRELEADLAASRAELDQARSERSQIQSQLEAALPRQIPDKAKVVDISPSDLAVAGRSLEGQIVRLKNVRISGIVEGEPYDWAIHGGKMSQPEVQKILGDSPRGRWLQVSMRQASDGASAKVFLDRRDAINASVSDESKTHFDVTGIVAGLKFDEQLGLFAVKITAVAGRD